MIVLGLGPGEAFAIIYLAGICYPNSISIVYCRSQYPYSGRRLHEAVALHLDDLAAPASHLLLERDISKNITLYSLYVTFCYNSNSENSVQAILDGYKFLTIMSLLRNPPRNLDAWLLAWRPSAGRIGKFLTIFSSGGSLHHLVVIS